MSEDSTPLSEKTCRIIRSILITYKGGIPAEQLYTDYRDMIGEGIPFRRLGYDSYNSFLQNIPSYCKISRNAKGEMVVVGVVDDTTKHMQDLVAKSKNSKKKGVVNRPVRKPRNEATHWKPPKSANSPPGHHPAPHRPPGLPSRPFPFRGGNPGFGGGTGGRPAGLTNGYRGRGIGVGRGFLPRGGPAMSLASRGRGRGRFLSPSGGPPPMPAPSPYYRGPLREPVNKHAGRSGGPRGPGQSSGGGGGRGPGGGRGSSASSGGGGGRGTGQSSGSGGGRNSSQGGGQGQPSGGKSGGRQNQVKSSPKGGSGGHGHRQGGKHQQPQTNYKKDLQNYFAKNNLGEVPYKVAPVGHKGKEKYMATVTVEGTQFKTYPQTYNSRVEAEEAVAAEVVKKLGILSGADSTDQHTLETTDSNLYSSRIAELISNRPNGVWSTKVEEEYQDAFPGEKLPNLWYQEVESLHSIKIECPVPGRYIVFPVIKPESVSLPPATVAASPQPPVASSPAAPVSQSASLTPRNSGSPPTANMSSTAAATSVAKAAAKTSPQKEASPETIDGQMQPPRLQYPPEELWDVYVTFVRNTTHVCLRLIGEEYSERYEELSSTMDLHYFDKSAIPGVARPEVGKIYAAQLATDWHRVKVIEIRGIQCTCIFLDHGDQDSVAIEDLREIPPKFLELPLQAINVTLSGLEDYQHNGIVSSLLNDHLVGKSLVAKVDNLMELLKESGRRNFPSMVLFDTSSDIDVNLNQKILEQLISEDSHSKLPQLGGEVQVYLSHIAENGDLYVQKETNTFTKIEKTIASQGEKAVANGSAGVIGVGQLYLARFPDDGVLYRAEVLEGPMASGGGYRVFFVDFGNSCVVNAAEIYDMHTIVSTDGQHSLQELPPQALKCRLESVPPEGHRWSKDASKALRELVPEGEAVRLKVVGTSTADGCPLVELHTPNSTDGSINFDLSTEFDIFPIAFVDGKSPDISLPVSPDRPLSSAASPTPPTVSATGGGGSAGVPLLPAVAAAMAAAGAAGHLPPQMTNGNVSKSIDTTVSESLSTVGVAKSGTSADAAVTSATEAISYLNLSLEQLMASTPDIAAMAPLSAPNLPPETDFFDVNVTYAVSPSNFVVQPYSEMEKLEELMSVMNNFYNEDANLYKDLAPELIVKIC